MKEQANKELLYIYHTCSYRSIAVRKGYTNESLHEFAVTNSGLDDKYFPDSLVIKASKEYTNLMYSALHEQHYILQKTMRLRNKALNQLSLQLEVLVMSISGDTKELETYLALDKYVSEYIKQLQNDSVILKNIEKQLIEEPDTKTTQYGKLQYSDSLEKEDDLVNYERE